MRATPPPTPTHIGPYPVLFPLGEGGMARVFAVEDPTTGRHRAVKLLSKRGVARARFNREYRALARMDHPNIVKVYRFGVDELQRPYLVMELLDGVSVLEWVAGFGTPGSPERTATVVRVLTQLAEALSYLHRRGYIHRDLKSSNVMVLEDGAAKLLDFGATRGLDADASSITRIGEFVGTFAYASPEQIVGDTLDVRSDIYSLGVLSYRLLCGCPPFESDSMLGISRMHLEIDPEPPHERTPGVPEPLSRLVLTMLAKRPEDRVQVAAEVAAALHRLGGDEDVAPPTGEAPCTRAIPLVGRHSVMQSLQAMVQRARPGRMALLVGRPGAGSGRVLAEVHTLATQAGLSPCEVEVSDTGGLHLRSADGEGADLDVLQSEIERMDRPVVLLLAHLDRASPEGVEALRRFRSAVTERGLPALIIASILEHADETVLRLAFLDATRVGLRPLTRGETLALADAMLGEGVLTRRTLQSLLGATGGQPGFVVQVLQAMQARGLLTREPSPAGVLRWWDRSGGRISFPPHIGRILAEQLGGLPLPARRLLIAVALARDAADRGVLRSVLGVSEAALDEMITTLRRRGLIAPQRDGRPLAFAVELTGLALLKQASAQERGDIERRLAEALPSTEPSLDAVRLLTAARAHELAQVELVRCYQADDDGQALAAQLPLVGSVVERATRRCMAGPALLGRLELCWARGLAAAELDDPGVDESLQRAEEQAITPDLVVEVGLERARVHGLRGEWRDQGQTLEDIAQLLEGERDPGPQLALQLACSTHALHSGALDHAEQAAVQALVTATRISDPRGQGRARTAHAASLVAKGWLGQAEGQISAARTTQCAGAGERDLWRTDLQLARLTRLQGRFSDALELMGAHLDRSLEEGDATRIIALLPVRVQIELDLYRLGEAREYLAELDGMALVQRDPVAAADLACVRGRLALATGSYHQAVDALAEAVTAAEGAGLVVLAHQLRASLGEALALAGDPLRGSVACHAAVRGLTRIGHLPALAEACACTMRGQGIRVDPGVCFQPVMPWLMEQPMRLARMEYLLATAAQAADRGDRRAAHDASYQAKELLEEIAGLLSAEATAPFRVHPWFRQARRCQEAGATRRGR